MKIKFIIPILFFLFVSCTDEDDDLVITNPFEINSANISGKWYLKGGTTNGGAFQNHVHDCSTNRDYQYFDLNGELDFVGYDSSCTISDSGTSLWSLSGNTLTVSSLPGIGIPYSYVYVVQTLTSEELVLKQTYNDPSGQVIEISHFTRN